jgi:hypothetical protein
MPRPISWLTRLNQIRQTVTASVRSHYERREIEALFQIQPRTAQLLLEMLPTTVVGRSRLVERQVLADFLERINDAENPSVELERIRIEGNTVSRKKLRTLVRRDVGELGIDSLPANIELSPGRMVMSFRTIEDLAAGMYSLARIIEAEGDALAERYEFRTTPEADADSSDLTAMMEELEGLEKMYAG